MGAGRIQAVGRFQGAERFHGIGQLAALLPKEFLDGSPESLYRFLKTHPQQSDGSINYLIGGGWAVELLSGKVREHHDLDVVRLNGKPWQFRVDEKGSENYFEAISMDAERMLEHYSMKVRWNPGLHGLEDGRKMDIWILRPEFILVSKLVGFARAPREKDSEDISALCGWMTGKKSVKQTIGLFADIIEHVPFLHGDVTRNRKLFLELLECNAESDESLAQLAGRYLHRLIRTTAGDPEAGARLSSRFFKTLSTIYENGLADTMTCSRIGCRQELVEASLAEGALEGFWAAAGEGRLELRIFATEASARLRTELAFRGRVESAIGAPLSHLVQLDTDVQIGFLKAEDDRPHSVESPGRGLSGKYYGPSVMVWNNEPESAGIYSGILRYESRLTQGLGVYVCTPLPGNHNGQPQRAEVRGPDGELWGHVSSEYDLTPRRVLVKLLESGQFDAALKVDSTLGWNIGIFSSMKKQVLSLSPQAGAKELARTVSELWRRCIPETQTALSDDVLRDGKTKLVSGILELALRSEMVPCLRAAELVCSDLGIEWKDCVHQALNGCYQRADADSRRRFHSSSKIAPHFVSWLSEHLSRHAGLCTDQLDFLPIEGAIQRAGEAVGSLVKSGLPKACKEDLVPIFARMYEGLLEKLLLHWLAGAHHADSQDQELRVREQRRFKEMHRLEYEAADDLRRMLEKIVPREQRSQLDRKVALRVAPKVPGFIESAREGLHYDHARDRANIQWIRERTSD